MYKTIRFIGDIHGDLFQLQVLQDNDPETLNILLGDVGFGFGVTRDTPMLPNTMFIRGNHDNPAEAKAHPNYMGDCGYTKVFRADGSFLTIGYLSGEKSVDAHLRIAGRDWWHDEELTYSELAQAQEMFAQIKVDVFVSHGPSTGELEKFFSEWVTLKKSRTSEAVELMLMNSSAKMHVFGHMHINRGDRHSWCVASNSCKEMDV